MSGLPHTGLPPWVVAVYNLAAADGRRDLAGDQRARAVIRALGTDVLIVHVVADGADRAAKRRAAHQQVAALAEAVRRCWLMEPDRPAVAVGSEAHHTAILWHRNRVTPVGWRVVSGPGIRHAAAVADLELGGLVVRVAGYCATGFGPHERATESHQIAAALTGDDRDRPVVLAVSDPILMHGNDTPETVAPDPAEVLYCAGLVDAAVLLGRPWTPTIGPWPAHRPAPVHGSHRLDRCYVSESLRSTVIEHTVINTDTTRAVGPHLPLALELHSATVATAKQHRRQTRARTTA